MANASAEKIRELRALISGIGGTEGLTTPEARDFFPAPALACGLPQGAIVELLGPSRTEWFLEALKALPETRVFWCEKKQSILPTAIQQRGVDLSRVTFATLEERDLFTALRRVIQSQIYEFVLAPNEFREIKVFKAFQLLTEKSKCTLVLLGREQPSPAWPIALQLHVHSLKRIEVLRQKYGARE